MYDLTFISIICPLFFIVCRVSWWYWTFECARIVPAEATAATIEDAAGGRSSRTRAAHAALEMLPGLSATARDQFARRGKTEINYETKLLAKQL